MTNIPTRSDLVLIPNASTPADRSIEKRRIRKHFLLNVIRENSPISRAEISKLSGYNAPSVSSLVDELVADNLVWEETARTTARGRRPVPVQINGRAASVVGIDLGWSSTVGVLLDIEGNVISTFEAETAKFKGAKANVRWLREVIGELVYASDGPVPPICGIGISIPGLVPRRNPETPIVLKSPTGEIRELLSSEFEIPVIIDNDSRMMAIGSLWFGEGRNHKNFGVLNLGYGLGFGMVMSGKPVRGARGFAGEIGHIPFGEPHAKCGCGRMGCIQTVASGEGLQRMARERGIEINDVRELFELGRRKEPSALEIIDKFSDSLARAISTIFNLYDPAALIISGRVARSADMYLDDVIGRVRKYTLPSIIEPSRISISQMDVRLGPMGAAASILHRIYYSSHVEVDKVI